MPAIPPLMAIEAALKHLKCEVTIESYSSAGMALRFVDADGVPYRVTAERLAPVLEGTLLPFHRKRAHG